MGDPSMRLRVSAIAFGVLVLSLAIQRGVRILLICLFLCFTLGCDTVRIARPDQWTPTVKPKEGWVAANDAYAVSSPATTPQRKTIWVLGLGWNQRNLDPSDCLG